MAITYHANFNIEILCFLSVGYESAKNRGSCHLVSKLAPMVKIDEFGNKGLEHRMSDVGCRMSDVGCRMEKIYNLPDSQLLFFFSAVLMLVTKIRINSSVS